MRVTLIATLTAAAALLAFVASWRAASPYPAFLVMIGLGLTLLAVSWVTYSPDASRPLLRFAADGAPSYSDLSYALFVFVWVCAWGYLALRKWQRRPPSALTGVVFVVLIGGLAVILVSFYYPEYRSSINTMSGRLDAVNTVSVRPRVSGYVSAVRFREGAVVDRGDLLFEIDARPFQADVDRLRAELTRARATVQRARSEAQRAERLTAQDAMSREESDRRASFALESSAQVDAVAAALRAAELNLEFTRITAPISGRVGRAIVTEGNLVSSGPGEATLLTTVVSLDPVYAYFDADEQIFLKYTGAAGPKGPALREGRRGSQLAIRMALANDEGFPRSGHLDFVDNQLDGATGTIRGRAVFRNSDGQLTPGLFVRLRLAGTASYRGLPSTCRPSSRSRQKE